MTEHPKPGRTTPAGMVCVSFDLDGLARLKQQAAAGRGYADRLSAGLTIHLLTSAQGDAPYVLHAIDALEGLRPAVNTKPAAQFRRAPLHPLWHQHFCAPRHMIRNIGERWGVARGEGNRDLDRLIADAAASHGHDPNSWPGIVAHRFADGYAERSRASRLTGDWIIFAFHGGRRYYLDIATHEEGEPGRAAQLLINLRNSAAVEFPFAFDEAQFQQ